MNIQQIMSRVTLCLLALFTLAVAPTYSQTVTHVPLIPFAGPSTVDNFGGAAAGAGDVNGDGVDDLIVGAQGDGKNGSNSGSARVLSGSDGSVLYSFNGDSQDDTFGFAVSGAGDIDGDGFSDLIVGAPGDDNNGANSGNARVFSGADGSVLYSFDGDDAGDELGAAVSGGGDVNGDGVADLIVGIRGDDNNGSNSGSVRVFSGADGSIVYNFDGDAAGDEFGFSVTGAGDVNGDGFDDLIVGASGNDTVAPNSGSARVLSGSDGSVLYNYFGVSAGDFMGRAVNGAGDVNGDGFADLIVGIPQADNNNLMGSGSAQVFSGVDGSLLYNFDGNVTSGIFGRTVSGPGDLNGDGFGDLIIGAPNDGNGMAFVFSGEDGSLMFTFAGDSAGDGFGRPVSGAGDVNGDGVVDLVVGAPSDDDGGDGNGSARVFSGVDGSVLYTFFGDSAGDIFGRTASNAGDVNGDGVDDRIEGAPLDDNNGADSGSVRVISGSDDSVLFNLNGTAAGDMFGASVSGAGDVDGDGLADLIVGTPFADSNGIDTGSASVISGADGIVLYVFAGDSTGSQFGASVSGAGDVNGDGLADLIVGAPLDDNNGVDSGSVRVFSGSDGSLLYNFDGDSAGDQFGISVTGVGDANGDGFDDLIVGAPFSDNNGTDSGSARLLSGVDGSVINNFDGGSAGDQFGFSSSGLGDLNDDGVTDFSIVSFYGTTNQGFLYFSVVKPAILGDVNQDCEVNMLDIAPFLEILSAATFLTEADCNEDSVVNFLDIAPFIEFLTAG